MLKMAQYKYLLLALVATVNAACGLMQSVDPELLDTANKKFYYTLEELDSVTNTVRLTIPAGTPEREKAKAKLQEAHQALGAILLARKLGNDIDSQDTQTYRDALLIVDQMLKAEIDKRK